jgi:alkylation response protein AidB-like acyl-CoA dehydrogenase
MGDVPLPVGAGFLWEPVGSREVMAPERFTEEQRQIARAGRDFSDNEIHPRLAEIEAKGAGDLVATLLRKAGELGLLMVDVPAEYGGLGLDTTTSMVLAEQFSHVGSFSVSLGAHTGIGTMPIVFFGTPEQKQRYLPDLSTGKLLAAYALTEPHSGSDALAARTRAVRSADGTHFVLNGTKQFITNAGFADLFTVFAKADGDKFTAFLVERRTPGLSVGPEERKMGIRGSSTRSVILEDCRVPAANVLGEIGRGHRIAFNILNLGRIKLGVATVGACKYALAISTRYAKGREQFGKPIASFGLVAGKLAEMAIWTFMGETMGYRTTGMLDARLHTAATDAEKVDAVEEFSIESSIIKVHGSEILNRCADDAVQIHGGYGFIEDFEAERLLRDSRINRIFEGTNEINRLLVPGTLLKRAVTGRNPLLEHSGTIRERLRLADLPKPEDDPLGVEMQVVEFCKWITLYVLAVAAETYTMGVADEQEVLGDVADMVGRVYALDSAVQRVRQIMGGGDERRARIARDILTAFAPRAYGFVVHTGRHLLMDMCDEPALTQHLTLVNTLRMDWPTKVIAAKRRIAQAVLEADGYPLP